MGEFFGSKKESKKRGYSEEQLELIRIIEEARMQLESCRSFFEEANESRMIEYAIYMEQAAKVRYTYLLAEARKLNIRVSHCFKLNSISAV